MTWGDCGVQSSMEGMVVKDDRGNEDGERGREGNG